MFISTAYAQDAAAGGDPLMGFLPLILIFVVFYFLLIRPQQKRAKEHKQMIENLRRGDVIVTSGGIIGKITKIVDDNEVEAEIASGVRIRLIRNMISTVQGKTSPANDSAKTDKKSS
ncbi:preprotein translocase subunit YajC [Luteithermobacter gelatinilyticus]|uniref:preprotein translocase subunit YajC n=1 Tax=Luteithermobacter gelatinilyticus TaxID=2582913 RepID=UPI0011062A6B|nr:preprotein translocase subunit YajC [Luteithermobacter gelatinilyticus]|tara:strand:+ start:1183 stop:1533 length:351 start_codon:yes stop_codon:yes gene_type:complete